MCCARKLFDRHRTVGGQLGFKNKEKNELTVYYSKRHIMISLIQSTFGSNFYSSLYSFFFTRDLEYLI